MRLIDENVFVTLVQVSFPRSGFSFWQIIFLKRLKTRKGYQENLR